MRIWRKRPIRERNGNGGERFHSDGGAASEGFRDSFQKLGGKVGKGGGMGNHQCNLPMAALAQFFPEKAPDRAIVRHDAVFLRVDVPADHRNSVETCQMQGRFRIR